MVLDPPSEPVDQATPRLVGGLTRVANAAPLTVALVNDYELILRGLHTMLAPFHERLCVIEHELGGTPNGRADVALFDTFGGRRDALDRAATMIAEGRVDHVVMYTFDAPGELLEIARSIGVAGVILKSVTGEELVTAIERVVAGERIGLEHIVRGRRSSSNGSLSPREQEVLAMLTQGCSNAEIAAQLFLSVETVKTYIRRLFVKLEVSNRTQAAMHPAAQSLRPSNATEPPVTLLHVQAKPG